MLYWQGFGPDNDARREYLRHGLAFKMPGLMLYLALLAVYLAPIIAWWRVPVNRISMAIAVVVLLSYPVWPVVAADAQLAAGIPTAGFLHRVVSSLRSPVIEHSFWAIAAAIGAMIAANLAVRLRRAVVDANGHVDAFLCLSVLSFLFVMPFSYMYWEKYFMPLLPLATLAVVNGATVCAEAEQAAATNQSSASLSKSAL
jgi:hypothetical protein